jgi:KDO2-lipid IV(A) lauroyltransferase
MNKKATAITGIFLLKALSRLPFPVLYLISDIMVPVVYRLIRYRREVVRMNLMHAFPDKTEKERLTIEKRYYRILCDLLVETVKTRAMSREELSRRMIFRNPEVLDSAFESGKSVIVMAAHMGNWEWLLHMPLMVRHQPFFVYKPMENLWFDRFLNEIRERFGGKLVSMSIIMRKLLEVKQAQVPVLTWLAADQTPPWNHPFWTMFMHRKTQFFSGPARLAQRFDHPVFFQRIRRIKRGYYETWFELLFDQPGEVPEEQIIITYVRKVEQVIGETPEDYLWSHRRWKNIKHAPEHIPQNLSNECSTERNEDGR